MVQMLVLWTTLSFIVILPVWCVCMKDVSSNKEDKILTIILGIIGLPCTLSIILLLGIFNIIFKR